LGSRAGEFQNALHAREAPSTAYRQAALQVGESWMTKAKTADPENRLLWRMNLRRAGRRGAA